MGTGTSRGMWDSRCVDSKTWGLGGVWMWDFGMFDARTWGLGNVINKQHLFFVLNVYNIIFASAQEGIIS